MSAETDIQQAFRKALYYAAPLVRVVPVINEGRRTVWEQRHAKRLGLAKGFPDCMALWPGQGVAFVEFKTATGRISIDQQEWHERLDDYGHRVAVCRSAEAAVEFLRGCGAPIAGRIAA